MTRPLPKRGTVDGPTSPSGVYTLKVRTNGVRRPILRWDELTPAEQKEHDWAAPDEPDGDCWQTFVRYRGYATPLANFSRLDVGGDLYAMGWDGASSDSYFSGLVIRLVNDDYGDQVCIIGYHWQ